MTIRVKNCDEDRTYIENRIPSSASCPYIVLAATLAAGLDGIERKLEPPLPGQIPETSPDVTLLPKTLEQALICLKNDTYLIRKLGEEFVNWFVRIKERGDLLTLGNSKIDDESEQTLAMERYEYFEFA